MDLDFVVVPVMPAFKKAIGFETIFEYADIWPKIPEYVFSSRMILASISYHSGFEVFTSKIEFHPSTQ